MKKVAEQKQKHNTTQEILYREGRQMVEEMLMANQTRFIQETVEAEIDEFLCRKRYEHGSSEKGYRNGFYPKQIKLPEARITIKNPHLRNTKEKFVSRMLKGIVRVSKKVKSLAIEMYVRGLSTRDIEKTLQEPDGKPIFSRSMVSRLSERLYEHDLNYAWCSSPKSWRAGNRTSVFIFWRNGRETKYIQISQYREFGGSV